MLPGSHSFTLQLNGRARVLITPAFVSTAFDPKKTKTLPAQKQFNAIWDTGATGSVISKKVINDCNLKPIGMAEVHHAGGKESREVYLVNIGLPNKVGFAQLRVTEGDLVGGNDILIGMDIIGKGDFAITCKDEKTTFSFRVPSYERIDFVEQAQKSPAPYKRSSPKISRNQPCPCGSGKKYKNCCGKK